MFTFLFRKRTMLSGIIGRNTLARPPTEHFCSGKKNGGPDRQNFNWRGGKVQKPSKNRSFVFKQTISITVQKGGIGFNQATSS